MLLKMQSKLQFLILENRISPVIEALEVVRVVKVQKKRESIIFFFKPLLCDPEEVTLSCFGVIKE